MLGSTSAYGITGIATFSLNTHILETWHDNDKPALPVFSDQERWEGMKWKFLSWLWKYRFWFPPSKLRHVKELEDAQVNSKVDGRLESINSPKNPVWNKCSTDCENAGSVNRFKYTIYIIEKHWCALHDHWNGQQVIFTGIGLHCRAYIKWCKLCVKSETNIVWLWAIKKIQHLDSAIFTSALWRCTLFLWFFFF